MTLIQVITGLAGGLAFFMFGLDTASRAALETAGRRLNAALYLHTANRFKAALAGIPFGFMLPYPSTAPSVLAGMCESGLLSARQMVAVVLGMPIGVALLIELVAFESGTWAVFVLIAGLILPSFSRRARAASFGKLLLGVGLAFFGAAMMRTGADAALHAPMLEGVRVASLRLSANPFYLFIAGILISALLCSHLTAMALVFAFGVTSANAIPISLGAGVGASAAFLLAGYASPLARRAFFAHLLTRLLGASFFMLILARFTDAVTLWTAPFAVSYPPPFASVAHSHVAAHATLIHCFLNALIFLPLVPVLEQVVLSFSGGGDKPTDSPIASSDLADPSLALEKARLRIVAMGRAVLTMLRKNLSAFLVNEPFGGSDLLRAWRAVDLAATAVSELLRRVARARPSSRHLAACNSLCAVSKDIKAVADLVSGPLALPAGAKSRRGLDFSVEAAQRFERFHRLVAGNFSETLDLLEGLAASHDLILANAAKIESLRRDLLSIVARSASRDYSVDAGIDRIFHDAVDSLMSIHYYTCDMAALLANPPRV